MSSEDYTLDPDGDVFLILTDHVKASSLDNDCPDVENNTDQREIRVRCSSKHLTLASPVFNAMLSRNFKEGAALRSAATLELPLPDDDAGAVLILLSIIHVQTKKVPLEAGLKMLTRIAIIVDKYQLQTAVKLLSAIWMDRLKAKIPRRWTKDLQRWILITQVFQCPTAFKFATQIAERQSVSRIGESKACDLPIPWSIVGQLYLKPVP